MSIQPLITFKAGKCDLDTSSRPAKVKAVATPGYIYLHIADELVHFCWRPRSAPLSESELDLLMIPGDGSFVPYTGAESSGDSENVTSPTNGRVFALKFQSSSQRYLFWLQSKSQHPDGNASWFSPRDQKLGQIVDLILSGEEIDVTDELRDLRNAGGRTDDDDDDDAMEDVESTNHSRNRDRHGSTGGAGPDATGGDIREEGEESREGGADGGRAAAASSNDASALVQNFLKSLEQGGISGSGSKQKAENRFTTLVDLLPSSETIAVIDQAPESLIESLSANLPPVTLLLSQDIDDIEEVDPNSETAQAIIQSLTTDQKREVLRKVLRSPQLHQSLGSLTMAIRDGGLPTISEALKIKVENGGFIPRGAMPMGGGDAVEAFLNGVKKTVEEEDSETDEKDDNKMETD